MESLVAGEDDAPAALAGAAELLDTDQAGGRILRGGVLRSGGYALMVALSVLSTAVITRHLGVASFGYYTTVLSLVAVVAYTSDAGMAAIGIREFSVRGGAERAELMRDLLGLRIALAGGGVVVVAAFALAAGYRPALLAGAVLASLGTVALVVQHTHTIAIAAELRIGTLAALELARQAISVALIVALVVLGAGVLPLLAVVLAANLLLIAPTAALARRRVALRVGLSPRRWAALLRLAVSFSLASAVGTLYIYAAQIVASLVASEHQSGLFAASFRIVVVAGALPSLLVTGALPLLARSARDDRERLRYALSRIFEVSLIVGVGAALATLGGAQFMIAVVAGPRYAPSAGVLQVEGLALIATFVLAGWSFALLSLERHRAVLLANSAAFAASVAGTAVLAGRYGADGAAIATVCGESVLALALLLALVRAHPDLRPGGAVVLKVALAAAPAAAVALGAALPSVVRMLLALAVYTLLVIVTRALPDEVFELLPGPLRRAGRAVTPRAS